MSKIKYAISRTSVSERKYKTQDYRTSKNGDTFKEDTKKIVAFFIASII